MTDILDAYVVKADSAEIRVVANSEDKKNKLQSLGFIYNRDLGSYINKTNNIDEKAGIFKDLRDEGICFSSGKEWSPAEVFEYLRDLEKISGSYVSVSWTSPNNWIKKTQ